MLCKHTMTISPTHKKLCCGRDRIAGKSPHYLKSSGCVHSLFSALIIPPSLAVIFKDTIRHIFVETVLCVH